MAPEIVREEVAGVHSDIFSLVSLYGNLLPEPPICLIRLPIKDTWNSTQRNCMNTKCEPLSFLYHLCIGRLFAGVLILILRIAS